jgi:hypothetical protein
MSPGEQYLGIISNEELEALHRASPGGRIHPLASILLAEPKGRARFLIESCAKLVFEKNPGWLRALKPRLLATDDLTHASSALGEIRAYGYLLETWMDVTPAPIVPNSNVSPEFEANNGDGSVVVEVHTRQLDEATAASLDDHHGSLRTGHQANVARARREGRSGNIVTIATTEVMPTGQPRPNTPGDTWVTNTISRIARIKDDERQIDPNRPFVLWLDFHDQTVWGPSHPPEFFRPLFSQLRDGKVDSGPFWFALYGRKDSPLIYSQGFDYRSLPMAHEGRFYQTMKFHGGPTRVSAVVYSLPEITVLMENPVAPHPLPDRFRAAILKVPHFRADLSVLEWKKGLVARQIALEHEAIAAAADALVKFDAAG